jgi:hypothetical protein
METFPRRDPFKITDVDALISPDLLWAQRAQAHAKAFSQRPVLVVVDAPTPELADQASAKLKTTLNAHSDQFPVVTEIGSGRFFARNGEFSGSEKFDRTQAPLRRASSRSLGGA